MEPPSWSARISSDGQNVVVTKGRSIVVYGVDERKWAFLSLPEEGRVTDVEFSPDGKDAGIAIACGQVCSDGKSKYHLAVLDLRAKHFVEGGPFVQEKIEGFQFSSRGIFLATYCEYECEVGAAASELKLFDSVKQSIVQRIGLPGHISKLMLSANGRTMAFMDVDNVGSRIGVLDIAADLQDGSFTAENVKFIGGGDLRRVPAHISIDGRFVAYTVQASNYAAGQTIGIAEIDGDVQERILQGEGFAALQPAGFDAKGSVIFTGIGPRGALAETLRAKLASIPASQRSFGDVAYAVTTKDSMLMLRINEEFGQVETGRLTCARDCNTVAFVRFGTSSQGARVLVAENGMVREAARLPLGGGYSIQGFSANGKRMLLDSFVLDLGNVPTVVDVSSGAVLPLPVLEFDKAEAAALKQMR
jgi:hypothetical protein